MKNFVFVTTKSVTHCMCSQQSTHVHFELPEWQVCVPTYLERQYN